MYMNGEIPLRVVTATAEVARGLLFTPPTTSQQQLEAPSQKRISTEEVLTDHPTLRVTPTPTVEGDATQTRHQVYLPLLMRAFSGTERQQTVEVVCTLLEFTEVPFGRKIVVHSPRPIYIF